LAKDAFAAPTGDAQEAITDARHDAQAAVRWLKANAATYRAPKTFWSTTIASPPDAWIAHNKLGLALALENDLAGAVREYEHALRVRPDYFEARMNLGNALRLLGRAEEGIAALRATVEAKPGNEINFELKRQP